MRAAELSPANTLDGLLQQAAIDPAYGPEFYRRLLLEPLIVLTADNPATVAPQTTVILEANSTLQVLTWEDGSIPIFTTPERILDKGVIKHQVSYVQIKGRTLLETLAGARLLLNPYSDYCKELLPEEVGRLLRGESATPRTTITIEEPTSVQLGQPAIYPSEMTQALSRFLSQQPRVRAAYLALIHYSAKGEPPHYIICLDVEGEIRSIAGHTGLVAQRFLGKGEFIDIVQAEHSELTDYFRSTKPFYQR